MENTGSEHRERPSPWDRSFLALMVAWGGPVDFLSVSDPCKGAEGSADTDGYHLLRDFLGIVP